MEARQTSKEQTQVVNSTTVHNLWFCVHTLCMNYVINTFCWLVPQYGVNNYFQEWLVANKLTLNAKKSSFVIFHPYQKKRDRDVMTQIFDIHTNEFVLHKHKISWHTD